MSNFLSDLFGSKGLKRRLAALLQLVAQLAQNSPQAAAILPALQWLAGVFGVTGVVHGAQAKTIGKYSSLSIASVISALLLLAKSVPQLQPYIPLLNQLAIVFSTLGLSKQK